MREDTCMTIAPAPRKPLLHAISNMDFFDAEVD